MRSGSKSEGLGAFMGGMDVKRGGRFCSGYIFISFEGQIVVENTFGTGTDVMPSNWWCYCCDNCEAILARWACAFSELSVSALRSRLRRTPEEGFATRRHEEMVGRYQFQFRRLWLICNHMTT